jgi:hypothetical protein
VDCGSLHGQLINGELLTSLHLHSTISIRSEDTVTDKRLCDLTADVRNRLVVDLYLHAKKGEIENFSSFLVPRFQESVGIVGVSQGAVLTAGQVGVVAGTVLGAAATSGGLAFLYLGASTVAYHYKKGTYVFFQPNNINLPIKLSTNR